MKAFSIVDFRCHFWMADRFDIVPVGCPGLFHRFRLVAIFDKEGCFYTHSLSWEKVSRLYASMSRYDDFMRDWPSIRKKCIGH